VVTIRRAATMSTHRDGSEYNNEAPCPILQEVQGQRSLSRYSSEGFDEEFVVPSAGTAFHDQAVFAWMLFQ